MTVKQYWAGTSVNSPDRKLSVATPSLAGIGREMLLMAIASWLWFLGPRIDMTFIVFTLLLIAPLVGMRLLTACRIYMDAIGLEVHYIIGRNRIDWQDVTKAAKRDGTVYLYAGERRLTFPSAEYWRGADRQKFLRCLGDALVSRGVELSASVRSMLAHARHI